MPKTWNNICQVHSSIIWMNIRWKISNLVGHAKESEKLNKICWKIISPETQNFENWIRNKKFFLFFYEMLFFIKNSRMQWANNNCGQTDRHRIKWKPMGSLDNWVVIALDFYSALACNGLVSLCLGDNTLFFGSSTTSTLKIRCSGRKNT